MWLLDIGGSLLQPQSTLGYKSGLSPLAKEPRALGEKSDAGLHFSLESKQTPARGELAEAAQKLLAGMEKPQKERSQLPHSKALPQAPDPLGSMAETFPLPFPAFFPPKPEHFQDPQPEHLLTQRDNKAS